MSTNENAAHEGGAGKGTSDVGDIGTNHITSATVDSALAYARRGWPVHPCKRDKTPFTAQSLIVPLLSRCGDARTANR